MVLPNHWVSSSKTVANYETNHVSVLGRYDGRAC